MVSLPRPPSTTSSPPSTLMVSSPPFRLTVSAKSLPCSTSSFSEAYSDKDSGVILLPSANTISSIRYWLFTYASSIVMLSPESGPPINNTMWLPTRRSVNSSSSIPSPKTIWSILLPYPSLSRMVSWPLPRLNS